MKVIKQNLCIIKRNMKFKNQNIFLRPRAIQQRQILGEKVAKRRFDPQDVKMPLLEISSS